MKMNTSKAKTYIDNNAGDIMNGDTGESDNSVHQESLVQSNP